MFAYGKVVQILQVCSDAGDKIAEQIGKNRTNSVHVFFFFFCLSVTDYTTLLMVEKGINYCSQMSTYVTKLLTQN